MYVTQGKNIIKVSPDGSSVTLFTTIPSLPSSHNGITFDHVGTFGYDMIVTAGTGYPQSPTHVTGASGEVWRVNSAGVATLVATVPGCPGSTCPILEGVEVAPLGFAPTVEIITTSENTFDVWAISASGVVTKIYTWPGGYPEDIRFIPDHPCNFGRSGGMYFDTIFSVTPGASSIWKFPETDFVGLAGSALLTSEYLGLGGVASTSIRLLTSTGGIIVVTPFATDMGQIEGSTIVDCTVPNTHLPVGGTVNGVSSLTLLSPWLAAIGLVGCTATVVVFVKKRRT